MPEADRFEKKIPAGWRAAYRDARSDAASGEEVSDKLVTPLCKYLRDNGGVPGFHQIAAELTDQDPRSISERIEAIDRIVKEHGRHRHTLIAAEAAKSTLILREAMCDSSGSPSIVQQFGVQVCKNLIEHYFFANARINLVAEGVYATEAQTYEWQSRIEDLLMPRIENIAAQLCERPDAKGLRAPKRIVRRQSTSSLLDQDLTTGGTAPPTAVAVGSKS